MMTTKDEELGDMAMVQARAGRFEDAIRTAGTMSDGEGMGNFLGGIVAIARDSGMDVGPVFEEALKMAEKLSCSTCRNHAHYEIMVGLAHVEIPSEPIGGRIPAEVCLEDMETVCRTVLETAAERGEDVPTILSKALNLMEHVYESDVLEIACRTRSLIKRVRESEFQRPDFKKPTGQPQAGKAKEKR